VATSRVVFVLGRAASGERWESNASRAWTLFKKWPSIRGKAPDYNFSIPQWGPIKLQESSLSTDEYFVYIHTNIKKKNIR
jgi:hypothetical protein